MDVATIIRARDVSGPCANVRVMNDSIPGLGEVAASGSQGTLLSMELDERAYRGEVPNPVAHVHPLMSQPHMDRVFDYEIPAAMSDQVRFGTQVSVEIGSQRVLGFVVGRDSLTSMSGRLRRIRRVVSRIPMLTAPMYALCVAVAQRQAASVADALRLAIPNRHAHEEAEYLAERVELPIMESPHPQDPRVWEPYVGGEAFLHHLSVGQSPRAVCAALPGKAGGIEQIAAACAATLDSHRSVVVVVPTARRAARIADSLEHLLGIEVARLVSEDIQSVRYRNFLHALGGEARVVVGTRAASWAPVEELGLCIVVDDAAPTLREQRAPYCEARDVLMLRAHGEGAGFLVFSPYVSEQSAALVESGWAALLRGSDAATVAALPRISSPEQWTRDSAQWSRIPESAFALVRQSLHNGPVLVVVPRAGYLPIVACAACHALASCSVCGGALSIDQPHAPALCRRCGASFPAWKCPECSSGSLRAARVGSHRTAEEIGRAFPGVGVILSGAQSADGISENVSDGSRIVVATPGAEPTADGGFAAALVLDSRFLLGEGLGSETDFLRKAGRIVTRVKPARAGGHVMFAGGIEPRLLETLTSWRHPEAAHALLEERSALALPPTARWFAIAGSLPDLRRVLGIIRSDLIESGHGQAQSSNEQPAIRPSLEAVLAGGLHELVTGVELLGPSEARRPREHTIYLRTTLGGAKALAGSIRRGYREYSAKSIGAPLRIEVDPNM